MHHFPSQLALSDLCTDELEEGKTGPIEGVEEEDENLVSKYHGHVRPVRIANCHGWQQVTEKETLDGQRVFQAGLPTGTTLSMPSARARRKRKDEWDAVDLECCSSPVQFRSSSKQ